MTHCAKCGYEVPSDAPAGLCPKCALRTAMEVTVNGRRGIGCQFPIRFGKYELLSEIARGGMGVVYEARLLKPARVVALKMILAGHLATEEEVQRFLYEARTAANLRHPNIVSIHDIDECEGRHYFTMDRINGKSLAERKETFRRDPVRVARLMAAVAGAVSHAHLRGTLHRDLKPANILLEGDGRPLVTDFGLAKRVGASSMVTAEGTIVGTLAYMSPEQATGRSEDLTMRADVYSLGAILYELLTGNLPITGRTPAEMLQRLQDADPIPPRKLDPSIPRDLETICLWCLEKKPERRYSSPELARELERFLRDEPIERTRKRWIHRTAQRLLKRPLATAIGAEMALLLIVAIAAGLSIAAAQALDKRAEVLRTNVYAARTLAGAVLAQLRDYADALTHAAANLPPELAVHLGHAGGQAQEDGALERYCREVSTRYDAPSGGLRRPGSPPPFNTWFILDSQGVARARWPPPPREFLGKKYPWRNYFLGAKAHAEAHRRSAYVSRAFLSEADGTMKFGLSAPLFGPDGAWVGVIVAMADSGATLGTLRLSDLNDEHRTAVLAALRDHTREEAEAGLLPPDDFGVLVHDSLEPGQPTALQSPKALDVINLANRGTVPSEQLRLAGPDAVAFDDDSRDPLPGYGGQWLAGFAPVGHTGLVVIVQTSHDTTLRPNQALARRLTSWGGAYAILSAAFLAAFEIARRRAGSRLR